MMAMTRSTLARLILPLLLATACGGGESVTAASPVATVEIAWDGNPLAQSSTVQMKAVPRNERGAELLSKPVTWTSSNPALATVSASGLVTATGRTGSVIITAASEGKSGSAEVPLWWLYRPLNTYPVDAPAPFTVRDSALARDITIQVRLPRGAAAPLPVVLVVSSVTTGWTTQPEWGTAFAAAGYAVIHVGSSGLIAGCRDLLKMPGSECPDNMLGIDAAYDARVLLDNLAVIGRQIGVVLDASRVGASGHSNGGFVVYHLAGATVQFTSKSAQTFPDNRIAAFLSNAGPSTTNSLGRPSGWSSTSWAGITKPMMLQVSTGDATHVREPYDLMSPGNKYLAFFSSLNIDHGMLALQGASDVTRANDVIQLIATNGVAFFDAYVRGRAEAKEWLTTNQLARATKGVGQISIK